MILQKPWNCATCKDPQRSTRFFWIDVSSKLQIMRKEELYAIICQTQTFPSLTFLKQVQFGRFASLLSFKRREDGRRSSRLVGPQPGSPHGGQCRWLGGRRGQRGALADLPQAATTQGQPWGAEPGALGYFSSGTYRFFMVFCLFIFDGVALSILLLGSFSLSCLKGFSESRGQVRYSC